MDMETGYLITHIQGHIRVGRGYQGRIHPPHPGGGRGGGGGPDLLGFLPGGTDMPQMPSGWISEGSNQPDQPPGSLCAPPRAGRHCVSGGGQPDLPPMT